MIINFPAIGIAESIITNLYGHTSQEHFFVMGLIVFVIFSIEWMLIGATVNGLMTSKRNPEQKFPN